jgi:hypothetical protein
MPLDASLPRFAALKSQAHIRAYLATMPDWSGKSSKDYGQGSAFSRKALGRHLRYNPNPLMG